MQCSDAEPVAFPGVHFDAKMNKYQPILAAKYFSTLKGSHRPKGYLLIGKWATFNCTSRNRDYNRRASPLLKARATSHSQSSSHRCTTISGLPWSARVFMPG